LSPSDNSIAVSSSSSSSNNNNKKTKTTYLTDTAVPNTHNIAKTITEKQSKYQKLANEICAMWKQNTA